MLLLLTLLACADESRENDILALNGDPDRGETLFGACAGCHGADGSGGDGGPGVEGEGGREGLETILYGEDSMPAYASWSDQDLADVLAYVDAL